MIEGGKSLTTWTWAGHLFANVSVSVSGKFDIVNSNKLSSKSWLDRSSWQGQQCRHSLCCSWPCQRSTMMCATSWMIGSVLGVCLAFIFVDATDCHWHIFAVPQLPGISNVNGWIMKTFRNQIDELCAQLLANKCTESKQLTLTVCCFRLFQLVGQTPNDKGKIVEWAFLLPTACDCWAAASSSSCLKRCLRRCATRVNLVILIDIAMSTWLFNDNVLLSLMPRPVKLSPCPLGSQIALEGLKRLVWA